MSPCPHRGLRHAQRLSRGHDCEPRDGNISATMLHNKPAGCGQPDHSWTGDRRRSLSTDPSLPRRRRLSRALDES